MSLATPLALADTVNVYNNLGPGDTFFTGGGEVLGFHNVAVPFTSTADGTLFNIKLGLTQVSGSQPVSISLHPDAGGVPSATILESWTLGSVPLDNGLPASVFSSISVPSLSLGSVYWVVAQADPNDVGHLVQWNYNDQSISGTYQEEDFIDGAYTDWAPRTTTLPALQVNVTAVPEPSAALFLVSGLLILVVSRRSLAQR